MSWIKIEFQRDKAKENAKNHAEQIDYEKVRKITRAVVKEEMNEYRSSRPVPLTKEDIQEAVCNGIIHADTKREEIAREKIKNTNLSGWTIAGMIFFSLAAAFFLVLAISAVAISLDNILAGIINACKFLIISATYVLVVFMEYAMGKNKDKNFAFNMITVLLAFITFVVTIIQ